MGFPQEVSWKTEDEVNDLIWEQLHTKNLKVYRDYLSDSRYHYEAIEKEIKTGVSPCPDILTNGFGQKPSVLFIGEVYGTINEFLPEEIILKGVDRSQKWANWIPKLYKSLIIDPGRSNPGIYSDLGKIYKLLENHLGFELEIGFTEVCKTVLFSKNKQGNPSVSKLYKPELIKYVDNCEYSFLYDRIQKIKGPCIIFTLSAIPFLYLLRIFDKQVFPKKIKKLNDSLEILFPGEYIREQISISKYTVDVGILPFTESITFQSLFKVKGKQIYVIPLSHPSNKHYGHWPSEKAVEKYIKTLLGHLPTFK